MPYYEKRGLKTRAWARHVLTHERGTCTPKHTVLGCMYSLLGFDVRYLFYPMRWAAQQLDYPQHLLELARALPECNHENIQIRVEGKWVIVDATYDLPLARIGAHVTPTWDGIANCAVAVDCENVVVHDSFEQRTRYLVESKSSWTSADVDQYDRFCAGVNEWFTFRERGCPESLIRPGLDLVVRPQFGIPPDRGDSLGFRGSTRDAESNQRCATEIPENPESVADRGTVSAGP
ncbi:MAG: hypothetical protein KDC39_02630 [Actinobacteria bacterium]|nr:hypothetical protein [Actinomycetota bacterium]